MSKKPVRHGTPEVPAVDPRSDAREATPARGGPRVGLVVTALAAVVVIAIAARLLRDTPTDEGEEIAFPAAPDAPAPPERLEVRVVQSYPHAADAFTQGLVWHDGHLYESTGLHGRSSVRKVALESGEVLERLAIDADIFAEGLARVGDELFLLSWQEEVAQVFSVDGFTPRRRLSYEGEGWGLCFDGTHLVMSDGSSRLVFRDPSTFQVVRSVQVREVRRGRATPLPRLNELECVDGVVWANVWETDRIVRIDPRTGRVTGTADARGLLRPDERRDTDVLNGIAWIPERGRFVITGKLWPRLFEVEIVPAGDHPR